MSVFPESDKWFDSFLINYEQAVLDSLVERGKRQELEVIVPDLRNEIVSQRERLLLLDTILAASQVELGQLRSQIMLQQEELRESQEILNRIFSSRSWKLANRARIIFGRE